MLTNAHFFKVICDQEVLNQLVVDLKVRHDDLCPHSRVFVHVFKLLKKVSHGLLNQPSAWPVGWAHHGVRFTAASDAIGKHCSVDAIQCLLYQLGHTGFINVKLGRFLVEHVIERVSVDLLVTWDAQGVQLDL